MSFSSLSSGEYKAYGARESLGKLRSTSFYLLIPGILHGYSPIGVSIGVASLIIIVGSYITHGFNRTTTSAVLGMIGTVLITGLGAFWVVHAAHLSGYATEEEVSLNFSTNGVIDFVGLLFGGIMIGLLGVLYDIAIGQAVAVEELFRSGDAHLPAGRQVTRTYVYQRAIRIGREHIGALVNTLAIAYVGAALPLLLLVQNSSYGILYAINNEIFADRNRTHSHRINRPYPRRANNDTDCSLPTFGASG